MPVNVYAQLSHPAALVVFVLTLVLPIGVGFLASRRTRNQSDFFVGGRSMDRMVVALSAVSSGRSGWLVLGVSGIAYKLGFGAVWAIVGYIAVEALQFVTLGKRLREAAHTHKCITLLDYFEARYRHRMVRIVAAVIIAVFMTAYVAAQFSGGAKSMTTALGIPLPVSLAIAAALVLVYMALGGYVAVAYNDVVRAVLMLIGLVVLPVVGLLHLGGPHELASALAALDPSYADFTAIGAGAIVGFVGIGLGSPGQPHIVVRYMSIDDPANLRFSAVVGTLWNIVLGIGAVSVGLLGRVFVPSAEALPQQDPEVVYLVLSSHHFGPVLYGLLVGGVFAAILSTADSQLLVVASTFVRDIYEKMARCTNPPEEAFKLKLSRLVVVVCGLFAILLAYVAEEEVFLLVLFAWGGLGAALGPALILSLYWRRTSPAGVVAGMVTGALVEIAWKLHFKASTGLYELIPAFAGALVVIVLTSVAFPQGGKAEHSLSASPG